MRQFYWKVEKGATVWHQLSWSHYKLLISLETIEEINYYSMVAVDRLSSVRKLESIIKSNEYGRLSQETKDKLINKEELKVDDLVKNPIVINNPNNM